MTASFQCKRSSTLPADRSCTVGGESVGTMRSSWSPLTGGITGLFFCMPDAWQRERRAQMCRTLPENLVRALTHEAAP